MPGGSQMPSAIPRAQLRNVFLSVNVLLDPFTARTAGPARTPAGPTMLRNVLRRTIQFAPPMMSTPLVFASLEVAGDLIGEAPPIPFLGALPGGGAVVFRKCWPPAVRCT